MACNCYVLNRLTCTSSPSCRTSVEMIKLIVPERNSLSTVKASLLDIKKEGFCFLITRCWELELVRPCSSDILAPTTGLQKIAMSFSTAQKLMMCERANAQSRLFTKIIPQKLGCKAPSWPLLTMQNRTQDHLPCCFKIPKRFWTFSDTLSS